MGGVALIGNGCMVRSVLRWRSRAAQAWGRGASPAPQGGPSRDLVPFRKKRALRWVIFNRSKAGRALN